MKKKKMMLILVLLLAIGFASVSTTLIITGVVGVSSKQEDFNVIFTNAILDGVERKDFIDKDDKQLLNFETNVLTTLGQTTTLNYEVTNASRNYDTEVTITCDLVDDADQKIDSEFVTMDYIPKSMTVVAGENETGSITATLKKTSTTDESIRVKCTLDAKPQERTSLGAEYKEPIVMPAGVELIADADNDGTLNVGDEIAIGDEHFYVISHTTNEINALAKYNLNVGDNKNPNVTEGIQHETVKGKVSSGTTYGTVAFSNDIGWALGENIDIRNASYTDGPVKTALYGENGYEKYMQNTISDSSVRLITKDEANSLSSYSWLYSTSYWTQTSPGGSSQLVSRVAPPDVTNDFYYYYDYVYGVRPVITIPLS